jgi:DNA polymerase-4
MRLRDSGNCCSLVSVHYRTNEFYTFGRQRNIHYYTDSTKKIASVACELFDDLWKGEPMRHIGVRVSELSTNDFCQVTLFEEKNNAKNSALDKSIDNLRLRFGSKAVIRCTFLHSGIKPLMGGVQEDDYQMMSSML